MNKKTLQALGLLFLLTIVFDWKILLTRQFSILTEEETVRQSYCWFSFLVSSIRHGSLPLWDAFTAAGNVFAGEMQTAGFHPLRWLLAIMPLDQNGLLSPYLYGLFYALTHFLGACFMFALVRELRLSRFAAIFAALCFSMGGFIAHAPWPHMYESAIWCPLTFLFLLRATRSEKLKQVWFNASMCGVSLRTRLMGATERAVRV